MEKPATDIYTFKDLRERGFTYVDKAGMILPLVDGSIGKRVIKIGVSFSTEKRTIVDVKVA